MELEKLRARFDAQVREIRRRYARGELQREIAADFDIYQASVSKIVRRERLTAVSDD